MKKIVFGITSLGIGGAERVLVDLANELSKSQEYKITIFTIYGQGELEKQVASGVELKSIYPKSYNQLSKIKQKLIAPLSVLIGKNKIYKKHIKNKYDTEIAFLEGPTTRIFACGKENKKKIAWIHNDIAQVFGKGIKAKLKRKIDEKLYEKFAKLVFVSNSNLETFKQTYPNNNAEKQVIYNYIDSKKVLEKAEEKVEHIFNLNEINLITVARLVQQKGLDRLIRVHARLIKDGINHNIYIVGDGPEKLRLQELIKNNNCENTIKLLGQKENPYPYIRAADYFCLLSHFEGYPMVVEEAKILNQNILITDTAAREVVKGYIKSEIFGNSEESIYQGLKDTLTNKKDNTSTYFEYSNLEIIEQVRKIL